MSDKIRLNNPNKFAVGIITPEHEFGLNILPGAFTMVTQDEIEYLMATSTLFSNGVLRLPEDKQNELASAMGIEMEDNANFMSDEDIKRKLSANMNQFKKWLDGLEAEPYVMDRVAEIAKNMNISINKVQLLQDKMPNYEFIEK